MERPFIPTLWRRRAAAATGILFFALIMAAPEPGGEGPSAAAIQRFYLENQQRFGMTLLMVGLAYALFICFVTVLRSLGDRVEPGDGPLSSLVMGSGLLVAGFHVLATALWAAPGLEPTADVDASLVQTWSLVANGSQDALVMVATFWRGIFLAAVALLALRHAALPTWLGWLAAVVAAVALIASVGFVESPIAPVMGLLGFGSYFAFHLWILLASIVVTVRVGTARASSGISGFEPGGAKALS